MNSIKNCDTIANERNGRCLTRKYINNKTRMVWKCYSGHTWEARYADIRRGSWCPMCRKNSISDCKKIAKSRGGKCITKKYKNAISTMVWECGDGHRWTSRFNDIKQGRWCPQCAKAKYRLEDCVLTARKISGKCLSSKYVSSDAMMIWSCKNNHKFKKNFSDVLRGRWCAECKRMKHIQWCNEAATNNGGKFLGPYKNSYTKVGWECSRGHTWLATMSNMKARVDKGNWCSRCAGINTNITIHDCSELARTHGGKCCSKKYNKNFSLMKWSCKNNHMWEASYANIKSGTWCPICRLNKKQHQIANVIYETFGDIKQNYRKLGWLTNADTGNKLEVDIYVEKIGLAIEYDGEQHFYPVRFGGVSKAEATRKFKNTLKSDKLKNTLMRRAISDGKLNFFIRFNYREPINKKYILDKLKKHGII